jgi:hypothetical protein
MSEVPPGVIIEICLVDHIVVILHKKDMQKTNKYIHYIWGANAVRLNAK